MKDGGLYVSPLTFEDVKEYSKINYCEKFCVDDRETKRADATKGLVGHVHEVGHITKTYISHKESGIGYNGPKNTPFQRHQRNSQLRGVFPGNPTYPHQVCKLTGEGGCNYPALIGNNDFYGGTGDEFISSTSSIKSGPMVLRHEMGHIFAKVGEEYDASNLYKGVNHATSLSELGWKDWLTGPVCEERTMYHIIEYPWHVLFVDNWSKTFTLDGS
ncbi:hypothetical protein DSO57_1003241 [Entomophthora muscae]|uniref:Uncharacterized protein n=1 Tax=Entomophthora muscae TaxID=34485 RepID=A0ACC2TW98_9FUNG|nr:hypothetical protein DSO57_1003241 [Entomophthora muscae]